MPASKAPKTRDPSSRAPIGLSVDDVVTAALELLAEFGPDGPTTRRLAGRLGVTAPTIYWHVQSKARLWELMAEHVVNQMNLDTPTTGPWDDRLRAFVNGARRELTAHAHIHAVLQQALPRASRLWATTALRILLDAGFSDDDAVVHARVVIWHIVGFTTIEANIASDSGVMRRVGARGKVYRVRQELDPTVSGSLESTLAEVYFDAHHAATLELLIAGLRDALELRRAKSPGRPRRTR